MAGVDLVGPLSNGSHLSNGSQIDDLWPDGGTPDPVQQQAHNGIPDALLVAATGVLLVALAYARARESLSFAEPLFWTGQVLIFAFVVFRVLNPSTSPRDREFLLFLYAGAQSMIRWAYSPVMYQWYDELQHLRSILNILETHHLFHTNYNLPISPLYPGMENVTAELAQVSSTGPFVAGVLIATASHLLLIGAVLLLFREVSQSSRVACIAVLFYLLSPQLHYFDTSFIYESVALPFLALAIFFAIRFARREQRYQSFAGVLACVVIAVMTHHLTALATVGVLSGIALATWVFPGTRNLAAPLAICAAAAAVIDVCWVLFVAPATLDYLGGAGPQILNGISQLGKVEGKSKLPTGVGIPLIDRLCNPGGVALMLVLLAVSIRLARSLPPLQRLFIWVAPGLYGMMISIRLFVGSSPNGEHPDGAELAIRSLTYSSLFTAIAVAVVLDRLVSTAGPRLRRPVPVSSGLVGATAIAVALFLHSTTTGLPQWWQRLPGPFRVDGYVSGIDAVGVSRAEWAGTHLPAGSRYFGDLTSMVLVSAMSQLDPVGNPGSIFDTTRLIPEDSALIGGLEGTYLDVDTRMAQQSPITHYFFKADVMVGKREAPIYAANLAKFDDLPGISRIYDSGYDHFYDLRGMQDIYGS